MSTRNENDNETKNIKDIPWIQEMIEAVTFAGMLRNCRQCEGWTQQETADKLGIKKQTLSSYERGIRQPSIKQAKRFGEIFGMEQAFVSQYLRDEIKESGMDIEIKMNVVDIETRRDDAKPKAKRSPSKRKTPPNDQERIAL